MSSETEREAHTPRDRFLNALRHVAALQPDPRLSIDSVMTVFDYTAGAASNLCAAQAAEAGEALTQITRQRDVLRHFVEEAARHYSSDWPDRCHDVTLAARTLLAALDDEATARETNR